MLEYMVTSSPSFFLSVHGDAVAAGAPTPHAFFRFPRATQLLRGGALSRAVTIPSVPAGYRSTEPLSSVSFSPLRRRRSTTAPPPHSTVPAPLQLNWSTPSAAPPRGASPPPVCLASPRLNRPSRRRFRLRQAVVELTTSAQFTVTMQPPPTIACTRLRNLLALCLSPLA